MDNWGIIAIFAILIPLIVESRVQIAYIKGKLEVLEKKIENGFKGRCDDAPETH